MSLVCSLLCCIPVTPILGIILGITGLVATRDGAMRGRGLAITGIILGIVMLPASGCLDFFGYMGYKAYMVMYKEVPQTVMAGSSGDFSGFRAGIHGDGELASDDEIQAFFDELEARHGTLKSCRYNEQAPPQQPQFGAPIVPFPYVLRFDSGEVDATIEIAFSDPQQGGFVMKMGSITVHDDDRGDLEFPPSPDS